MSLLPDLIGGAIGAFAAVATVAISLAGYNYNKKRNAAEDIKEAQKQEVADAVALSGAVNDIGWIREQLGEKPNGGGAMEQILANQKISRENQETMQKMIVSLSDSIRAHLTWHIARDK